MPFLQNFDWCKTRADGFIRMYDGTSYLTLFGSEKHDAFWNRVRYLISLKSKIKTAFYHYLPLKDW